MELKINYILSDYIKANQVHAKNSNSFYFNTIVGLFFLIFSIFMITYKFTGFFTWLTLILSLAMITYPVSVIPLLSRNYMKKQKSFEGPVTIKFLDNFIFENSLAGEEKIKWIHKIVISKELLLIYTTLRSFIIIPAKYCSNEEQFNNIIEYVKSMPGSGKIYISENLKANYSFISILVGFLNFIIFIIWIGYLHKFSDDAKPVIIITILGIFAFLVAVYGAILGFISVLEKKRIVVSSFGLLINLINVIIAFSMIF